MTDPDPNRTMAWACVQYRLARRRMVRARRHYYVGAAIWAVATVVNLGGIIARSIA